VGPRNDTTAAMLGIGVTDQRQQRIRLVVPLCLACLAARGAGHYGCAPTCQHQSRRHSQGTRASTVLPELFFTTAFPITLFGPFCRISRTCARRLSLFGGTSRDSSRREGDMSFSWSTSLSVINAQAMRAILFASATVTSLTGRHSKSHLVQIPGALFHCGAR
jgi:hypothetical protein